MTLQRSVPMLLVGGGKMGAAMLRGWLDAGMEPAGVSVLDPHLGDKDAAALAGLGVTVARETKGLLVPQVMVIAVKPQVMDDVLGEVAPLARAETLVLSVAAGIPLERYEAAFGPDVAVVRAMPNTPAAVGKGITALIGNDLVGEDQHTIAEALSRAVGDVIWLSDEAHMDAVTGVSGSGPAYVFLMVEALADAGVAAGLDAESAVLLARQTVIGAGALLDASDLPASTLRRNVTSPGGTTQAALDRLMAEDGLALLMRQAVGAATRRSRELSGN
ncbi:MAG: pyrroline-5-carboxylate reductase [Hyphomicrobiaceae bacterium]|nr:pyrroline-5-carboxylate reductase [Hyphomicrobiaceae bacterium]